MSTTVIVLIVIALLVLFVVGMYNRLVTLRNQVKNAWSQIDVQLQRRYDLIPNLIETVKGYMSYEKGTLEAVVQARNQASAALQALQKSGGPTESSLKDVVSAENNLRSSMANIFALAENYPQLKASENMTNLQEELSSTENKIAFARQAYNDQVLAYNTAQQTFPTVMFAQMLGHKPADMYEVTDPNVRQAVKVSF